MTLDWELMAELPRSIRDSKAFTEIVVLMDLFLIVPENGTALKVATPTAPDRMTVYYIYISMVVSINLKSKLAPDAIGSNSGQRLEITIA